MAELPLPPSLGAALLAGAETGCAREVAAVAALLSVRSVWVNRRGEEALLDEEKARHAPLTVTFKVCLPGEQHAESQAHAPSPRQLHCCMPYLGDGPGGYATVCIAACWHLMTRIHSCQAAGKCRAQGYTTSCRHHSC